MQAPFPQAVPAGKSGQGDKTAGGAYQNAPPAACLHLVDQSEYDGLPLPAQSGPAVQKPRLGLGQGNGFASLREELGEGMPKAVRVFSRGSTLHHILAIPGGNGGLGQTGALRELIFCPPLRRSVAFWNMIRRRKAGRMCGVWRKVFRHGAGAGNEAGRHRTKKSACRLRAQATGAFL